MFNISPSLISTVNGSYSTGAEWVDINKDGWLDLLIQMEMIWQSGKRLYIITKRHSSVNSLPAIGFFRKVMRLNGMLRIITAGYISVKYIFDFEKQNEFFSQTKKMILLK